MKKLTLFLTIFSFLLLSACGQSPEEEISKVYQDGPPITNQKAMSDFDQTAMPEAGDQIVTMETTMGTIKIKLFPENFTLFKQI